MSDWFWNIAKQTIRAYFAGLKSPWVWAVAIVGATIMMIWGPQ